MSGAARSGLTLLGLGVLLVVATAWGWNALTEPFPSDEPVAICEDTPVVAGSEIRRDEIVVSVFNGSGRSGLAGATIAQLEERGFVAGDVGDAPEEAAGTQIWADDATNPAVQLVQRQFKGAKIVSGARLGPGVVVVLGEKFQTLRSKQVESIAVEADATYCRATGSE
jgi:hypothetical protein